MRVDIAIAIAEMGGTLAHEVGNLRGRVEECRRYIEAAHQKHDDLIATLDEIIRQQSQDLHADVQEIHDRLVEDWPRKPYFLKEDY